MDLDCGDVFVAHLLVVCGNSLVVVAFNVFLLLFLLCEI